MSSSSSSRIRVRRSTAISRPSTSMLPVKLLPASGDTLVTGASMLISTRSSASTSSATRMPSAFIRPSTSTSRLAASSAADRPSSNSVRLLQRTVTPFRTNSRAVASTLVIRPFSFSSVSRSKRSSSSASTLLATSVPSTFRVPSTSTSRPLASSAPSRSHSDTSA